MTYSIKIGTIRVQPDRLRKLEGKSNYDLISLKRALVDCYLKEAHRESRFSLRLDYRARLFTVSAKGCPVPAIKIASAFLEQFTKLTRISEPLLLVEETPDGGTAVFTNDSGIDVLGLLHYLKETGGFEFQA